MSGLDKLTSKILSDARDRAAQITGDAGQQAAAQVEEAASEARREKDRILTDAETEAARQGEQVILGRTLEVRDKNLEAKQSMLDQVFAQVLDRLNSLPREEYWKFLTDYLLDLDLDGEELTLPPQYGSGDLEKLNALLKEKGGRGNLKLGSGRSIQGGFVLSKNGIEQNNTFEALIGYYRYELESEVLKILYE